MSAETVPETEITEIAAGKELDDPGEFGVDKKDDKCSVFPNFVFFHCFFFNQSCTDIRAVFLVMRLSLEKHFHKHNTYQNLFCRLLVFMFFVGVASSDFCIALNCITMRQGIMSVFCLKIHSNFLIKKFSFNSILPCKS